ncbi:hypothetical protein H7171_02960 [Candidatus Saccharibacteria bacterium]|nr:hypothetical protein [Candidatus Saccharibacteria bacterium]
MTITEILAKINGQRSKIKLVMLGISLAVFLIGVALYLGSLAFNELPVSARFVPNSVLMAITPALSVLLVYELFVLILSVQDTLVTFIRHLFEVVSLIVIRDMFKSLEQLSSNPDTRLYIEFGVIAIGSLVVYFLVEVLERIENNFISMSLEIKDSPKKSALLAYVKNYLELLLILAFLGLSLYQGIAWLAGVHGTGYNTAFLNIAFSGVIFFNFILLFLSLFATDNYETLFEYSSLVLASAIVLIALPKNPLIYVPLIISALLFVIITMLMHGFARGQSLGSLFRQIKHR